MRTQNLKVCLTTIAIFTATAAASAADLDEQLEIISDTPTCILHNEGICPVVVNHKEVSVESHDDIRFYSQNEGRSLYIESLGSKYTVNYKFKNHYAISGKLISKFYSPDSGSGSNCGSVSVSIENSDIGADTPIELQGGEDILFSVNCAPEFKSWGDASFSILIDTNIK